MSSDPVSTWVSTLPEDYPGWGRFASASAAAWLSEPGGVAGYAGEVTTRDASNGLGDDRLRRLLQVGRTLVAELELESVLQRVVGTARELTGARYAALGILDEGKQELERFLYVGIDEEKRRQIGPLPRGRGCSAS